MPTASSISVEVRAVEPQRVATLTRTASGFGPESIGPVVGPMFPEVDGLVQEAGLEAADYGPAIACYAADESGDGTGVLVTAGFFVPNATGEVPGLDVTTLPAIEHAAVTVHRGEVAGIGETWGALMEWIHANGYELAGVCREV